MKTFKRVIGLSILCLLVFQLLIGRDVLADSKRNIILLIDNSTSMKETDPIELSRVAASLMIDTVKEDVDVNVIAFGTEVLSRYKLGENTSKAELKSSLSDIKFDNQGTDIKAGLEEAISQIENKQGEKRIILLSDGAPFVDGNKADSEYMDDLFYLCDESKSKDIKISTIGLSKESDEETLRRIASDGEDYYYCDTAVEVLKVINKFAGNLDDVYSLDEYIIDGNNKKNLEKEFKISSYIEEFRVKVISTEGKNPEVEILKEGVTQNPSAEGEQYKIYNFENSSNSDFEINQVGEGNNLVIVEIKSSVPINTTSEIKDNDGNDIFKIPCNIPLRINANIDSSHNIDGLYLYRQIDENKEIVDKSEEGFSFNFKEEEKGTYRNKLILYDGENNIVSAKDINLTTTEEPAFYYDESMMNLKLIDGDKVKIKLNQLDSKEIQSISGEVLVSYDEGNEEKKYDLDYIDETLVSEEFTFEGSGVMKVRVLIRGISQGKSFSYSIPTLNLNVEDRPIIHIDSEKFSENLKISDELKLSLFVKGEHLKEDETVNIFDENNEMVGSFRVESEDNGKEFLVEVSLENTFVGNNLSFWFETENGTEVTDFLETNINVESDFDYYLRIAINIGRVVLLIAIGILILCLIGRRRYKKLVLNFERQLSVSYGVYERVAGKNKVIKKGDFNVEITYLEPIKYLKMDSNDRIGVSLSENQALGEINLIIPKGSKILFGLTSIFNKAKLPRVEFIAYDYVEQAIENGLDVGSGSYNCLNNLELTMKHKGKKVEIQFL